MLQQTFRLLRSHSPSPDDDLRTEAARHTTGHSTSIQQFAPQRQIVLRRCLPPAKSTRQTAGDHQAKSQESAVVRDQVQRNERSTRLSFPSVYILTFETRL